METWGPKAAIGAEHPPQADVVRIALNSRTPSWCLREWENYLSGKTNRNGLSIKAVFLVGPFVLLGKIPRTSTG